MREFLKSLSEEELEWISTVETDDYCVLCGYSGDAPRCKACPVRLCIYRYTSSNCLCTLNKMRKELFDMVDDLLLGEKYEE